MLRPVIIPVLALSVMPSGASAQSCVGKPLAIQVLGSGGPTINPERASTSYLVWVGGQAKILVDAGGGAFLRFGQARAKLSDLSMVALTHLHPDHTSDLPALLWRSQLIRKEPLPITGPSGNEAAPDVSTFLRRLFDEKTGAFQVLGPAVGAPQGPTGGGVPLEIGVADVKKAEPSTMFDRQGVTVTALGVPHGNIPALAYRVQIRDVSIVFGSDQTGTNPKFLEFAKGANALIMHLNIAAGMTSPLHAAPAVIGRIAQQTGAGQLLVGHIGEFDLNAALAELKQFYAGPVTVAADLQCTQVQ